MLTSDESDHLAMWLSQKSKNKVMDATELNDYMGNVDEGILKQIISEAERGVGGHPGLGPNVAPLLRRVQRSTEHVSDLAHADDILLKYRKLVGSPKDNKIETYRDYQKLVKTHQEAGGIIPNSIIFDEQTWKVVDALQKGDYALNAQLNVISTQRAFNAVIPYIDDHKLRSQFQQWVGNFIPFWFAQEQFIKRWTRTIADSPANIRRMQLAYQGVLGSGIVTDDPVSGDKIFVMPGSAALTDLISVVGNTVFGQDMRIPVAMPLTGKLKYTIPGLDTLGIPSVGPTVAIPMGLAAQRFPELQGMHKTVTGQDIPRGPFAQLYPASLRRFTDAYGSFDPNGAKTLAASTSAMQYLEMTGNGIADDASPREREIYLERIQNWTRSFLLTQAVVGFVAPASPRGGDIITGENPWDLQTNMGLSIDEINDIPRPRFLELLNAGNSWEEAVEKFLGENVDATPHDVFRDETAYTVFKSQGNTGRYLPTSAGTFDWMIENEPLLVEHTKAAAWLIPHGERTDEYEWKSYNEQLAQGLRQHKTLEMFYEDVKFAAAMPMWQSLKDDHDRNLKIIEGGPEELRQGRKLEEHDRWRSENHGFKEMHPLWSSVFEQGEGRIRRREIIASWNKLRDDASYLPSNRFIALNGLFEMFQLYKAQRDQLTGRRGDTVDAFRDNLEERFLAAADVYLDKNPDAREFWTSVLKPEVS